MNIGNKKTKLRANGKLEEMNKNKKNEMNEVGSSSYLYPFTMCHMFQEVAGRKL